VKLVTVEVLEAELEPSTRFMKKVLGGKVDKVVVISRSVE
jgi:hypothetical protein